MNSMVFTYVFHHFGLVSAGCLTGQTARDSQLADQNRSPESETATAVFFLTFSGKFFYVLGNILPEYVKILPENVKILPDEVKCLLHFFRHIAKLCERIVSESLENNEKHINPHPYIKKIRLRRPCVENNKNE